METGKIAGWLQQVGDTVARGDVLAEIETEKSTVEMEAPAGRHARGVRPSTPGEEVAGRDEPSATSTTALGDRARTADAVRGPPSRHLHPDAPGDRPAHGRRASSRRPTSMSRADLEMDAALDGR